jgi:regulator of sirC expression with transglutaminase-like and TPR domain
VQYYDPRNSFLDEVLRRRRGIPISLSVVMLEIGRRKDVALAGIGLPGHFLVGAAPGVFYDPFHRGERLDEAGVAARFATVTRSAEFSPRFLEPIDNAALLGRMLANLVRIFVPRGPGDLGATASTVHPQPRRCRPLADRDHARADRALRRSGT